MVRIRLFSLILILVCTPLAASAQELPRALSLADVLGLVEERSPRLEAARWQVRAADGRAEQAGLFLNPELDVEVENIAGTGAAKGIGGAETTVSLGQTIELGGKRSGRSDVARHEREAARLDADQQRLDVFAQATRLFVAGLAAQERARLEEDAASLARETEVAVRRRVEAGRSPPAEALRAKVARARADVRLNRAKREV
ncbi:MAG: TolC family protein, partial [Chrysiogenetes bacterium]|nr:TolC family protein [Chrysiogenetes bacterium]